MKPKFEDDYGIGWVLLCPCCHYTYLHHEKVEVFERYEDTESGRPSGLHVTIDGGVKIDRDVTENPSSRRDGLKIFFWCEGCGAKPVLTLLQHKGNTGVDFTYTMPEGE